MSVSPPGRAGPAAFRATCAPAAWIRFRASG